MQAAELEDYLHRHIPLSAAMGIRVVSVEPGEVTLSAPLAPNINHRETVFGGSASAAAMLAAWTIVHTRLVSAGVDARVVIRRNTMEYSAPIAGDFIARAELARTADWAAFVRGLDRKGIARIGATARVLHGGRQAAAFEGEFVALRAAR